MPNIKVIAPYPRFRTGHMKFNVSGQRYCNPEDIKMLKKVDPNIGIFRLVDGTELNPKPKKKKKTKKQEAPDVLKNTKRKKP